MAWSMTPRNWGGGPEFDMQLAEEIERRIVGFEDQREQARQDPELARRLVEHSQRWGEHARPGVLEGMARAGLEADDEVSAAIAEEAGAQQILEGKPDIGEKVNGRDLRGSLTDAAKTFTRGAFTLLEAPFREAASAVTAAGATFLDDEQDLGDFVDNYTDHGGSRLRKAFTEWKDQGVDWRGLPILGDTVANALPEGDEGIRWTGEEEFLGEGWMPSQESGISQQIEEEKHRLSDDGEFLTPGRLIPHGLNKAAGRTIIEPDSTPYHMVSGLADFTANIALDPATYITGGYAKIAQASKKFGTSVDNLGPVARRMAESSLVPTPRADLIGENVDSFLTRPEGAAVTEAIRDITSPNTIRKGFNGKVDNDIAVQLARADSDEAVREVLGSNLGTRAGMMEKPRAQQFTGRREGPLSTAVGALHGERGLPTFDRVRNKTWQTSKLPGVRRNLAGVRLAHWAPQRMIDKNDPTRAAQQLDDHLRNAKVPDEQANQLMDEFMQNSVRKESGLPDFEAMSSSIYKVNQAVEEELFDRLASRRFIEGREARRARKSARQRKLDETGEDELSGDEIAEMVTDPEEKAALAETRRRAKDLAHVSTDAMEEYSRAARQYLHDEMGKPIIPPGGKRKMTVNGEEFDMNGGTAYMLSHARDDLSVLPDHREIRRVASQFGPLFDTPYFGEMTRSGIDFLHYKVMSKVWKPATLLRPAYMMRVVPEEQARIAAEGDASALNHPIRHMSYVLGQRGRGGLVDDDIRNAPEHASALNPKFSYDYQGAPIQHSQLSGDFVMRAARGKDGTPLEGTTEDWASYLGKFAVDPVARPMAGMDINDAKRAFWDGDLAPKRQELIDKMGMTALRNKSDADEWVDGLFRSMHVATGGDPSRGVPGNAELLSAINQGRISEVPVSFEGTTNIFTEPKMFRDPEVTAQLGQFADDAMPNFLPRPRRSAFEGQEQQGLWDRATSAGFATLVSKPSDTLSRSPHFKQRYWDRVDQMLPSMTRKAQRTTIQRAKKANLERSKIKAMERKAARPNEAKLDDTAFIDDAAKAQALDDTKELLYDVTRRSQFGEALRVAAPFAEAWKEIMATWFKLGKDNPSIIRRGQQAIDGARRSDPAEMLEGGDPSEGGFFYHEDDQEMFCVDEETEALTKRGWVKHHDLIEGDLVLALDPYSDESRWEPVQSVNRFPYDGDLVRWSGNVDALTTHNHRWLVEGSQKRSHLPDGPLYREFVDTDWVSQQSYRAVVVSGGTPHGFADHETYSSEFVELIGWFVTEGCHESDSYGVVVDQSERVNPEYVERIRVLSKHFGKTGATCTERSRRDGQVTFYFGSGIGHHVREAAPRKQLTPEFVTRMTVDQAELLLETLIAGDGHIRPDGSRQWFQNDSESVHTFQMLCSMLGIRTQLHWDGKRYMVWLKRWKHLYTHNARAEPYQGTVWCPTVESGVWLARRHGCTYWTGNSYPGGKQLARVIGLNRGTEGQADIELTGRVSGLNLIGNSVLPGLGPAVTIPASQILPESAKTGKLGEMIFPFGEPEADSPGAAIDDMAPPWLQRAITAWRSNPDKDRIFGNTVIDTMRALKATGNYSHPETGQMTREQMNRLEADGMKYAKRLYWFRSLAQTTMPTGPQPEFNVETPEEEMTFQALSEEYRKEIKENPREAFNNFTERFGIDLALSTQPKTKEIRPRAVTEKGLEWERQNSDLFESFPNVAGFFTPEDPEGEFDYNAYLKQLETGDRVDLGPDEVLQLQNHQLGRLAIENAERKLGEQADTSEGRAFLSRLRSQLKERYPGYLSTAGVPSGVDLDRQIAEFRKAANDERLRDHPISQATREWLRVRDTAESFAKRLPGNIKSFASAQAARPIRDWMRAEAQRIIDQHPQWAPVYDRVFAREMTSDDFEQEPQEADLTKEPDWSLGEES